MRTICDLFRSYDEIMFACEWVSVNNELTFKQSGISEMSTLTQQQKDQLKALYFKAEEFGPDADSDYDAAVDFASSIGWNESESDLMTFVDQHCQIWHRP